MAAPRQEILRAVADAHVFYRSHVARSWVPDHLNRRNLYPLLEPAGIGYAPAGWTATVDHLRGIGHAGELLIDAGLARRTHDGRVVDLFRDRLMVPLRTSSAELVGFIGRCAETAQPNVPKYMNSPQSSVFAKNELLYGLGEDRDRLRRGAMPILVEGPLDRLAIARGAASFAVVGLAPCGTALTSLQVQYLLDTVGANRPIGVALDPDAAGRTATLRAWDLLTAAGATNLLHVALPEGRDPAELIRNGRANRLRDAITRNRPLAFAVADQRIRDARPDPENTAQRVAIARHVAALDLRHVPGSQVGAYVVHLARELQLDTSTLTAIATDAISGHGRRPTDASRGFAARMCAAHGAAVSATRATEVSAQSAATNSPGLTYYEKQRAVEHPAGTNDRPASNR